jgi:hypothetical protein
MVTEDANFPLSRRQRLGSFRTAAGGLEPSTPLSDSERRGGRYTYLSSVTQRIGPIGMRSFIKTALLASIFAAAHCAGPRTEPGQTIVELEIVQGSAPRDIDHIDLVLTGMDLNLTQTVNKPAGQSSVTLPTTVDITLLTSQLMSVTVLGIARDATGNELARGSVAGDLVPMETLTLSLEFGKLVGGTDAGSMDASGGAILSVDKPTVDFGSEVLGSSTAASVVTLKNAGDAKTGPLKITLTGPDAASFAQVDPSACGGGLAAGASCAIGLVFRPDREGALTATLEISGGPSGHIDVPLSGQGVGPGQLALMPGSADFGPVVVGTDATPISFSVQNTGGSGTGTVTVSLTASTVGAYSLLSDGCSGQRVPAGGSCTIQVAFHSNVLSVSTATLAVSARPGGAQSATLFARGIAPASLLVMPGAQDFGTTIIGNTASAVITVKDGGGVATSSLSTALTGPNASEFSLGQDGCTGHALQAGAVCTITVAVSPMTAGTKLASLQVTAQGGLSATVNLTTQALTPGAITISPAMQMYGGALLHTDGAEHVFTVRNGGGAATGALSIGLSGSGASAFVVTTDPCQGLPLAGGATCDVHVKFHPNARSGASASLLASASPGGAATASLNGSGLAPALLQGDAGTAMFGTVDVTRSSQAFTWTVSNSGDVPSGPLSTALSGPTADFAVTDHCNGTTLAPLASCTIAFTFAPKTGGGKTLNVVVSGTPGGSATLVAQGTARPLSVLTVVRGGNGSGTVQSDAGGISCGTACSASFLYGTMVNLTATPATGSSFAGWSGACTGVGACSVSMTQAQNVSANFTLNTYALSVSGVPSGAVFTSMPALTCGGGACNGSFAYGTQVKLTGGNNAQYNFGAFSGGGCTLGTTCTITVSGPTTVAASYTLNSYPVTVNRPAGASLNITSTPALTCSGSSCTGTLPYGAVVSLQAGDNAQYAFAGYSGGGCGASSTCSVMVGAAVTVTASYTVQSYPVSVSFPSGAALSATSVPALTCSAASCSGTVPYGTMVSLVASNNAQYSFQSYTGGGCSTSASCNVTVQAATTVSAAFAVNSYGLSVTGVPAGANFTSAPALTCSGTTCSGTFSYGSTVVLTGGNNAQYAFTRFTGAGCALGTSCSVSITGATSVAASYGVVSYPVTVNRPAGAQLTITSAPALTCSGSSCTGSLPYGTMVSLAAANNAQYNFQSYSGGGCGTNATCSFPVQGPTTVDASFSLVGYSLTVTGVPAGAVFNSTPALTCMAGTCSGSFSFGTMVSLSGASNAQYAFGGLSGASCTGTMCTVTINGALVVNASYSLRSYPVTINRPAGASLSITSNPALTCAGASCTGSLSYGSSVVLGAANDAQYSFSSYTGGGCSTNPNCTVGITGPTTVTASYSVISYPVSVSWPSGATVGVSSNPALSCGATSCSGNLPYGTVVSISASNDAEYAFGSYTGGGCSTNPSCSVSVQGGTTVTANFSVINYTLTITGVPSGAPFTSSGGLTCSGGTCSGSYPWNTVVTFSGSANAQYSFGGFGGDCPAGSGSCSLTMTTNHNATASYSVIHYTLSLGANTGNGWGYVQSSDGAILCSFFEGIIGQQPYGPNYTACSASYPYGTTVTLTEYATQQQEMYATWPSGCDSTSGYTICYVYITGSRSVAPNFYGDGIDLTYVSQPDSYGAYGLGYVITDQNPTGINCGDSGHASCYWRYHWSATITLTAVVDSGLFNGWGGTGCESVNGNVCYTHAYGTKSITASFVGNTIF